MVEKRDRRPAGRIGPAADRMAGGPGGFVASTWADADRQAAFLLLSTIRRDAATVEAGGPGEPWMRLHGPTWAAGPGGRQAGPHPVLPEWNSAARAAEFAGRLEEPSRCAQGLLPLTGGGR